ncbi:hypothetical protein XENOCAPTIV_001916, partial [Xenoophorus captivus]
PKVELTYDRMYTVISRVAFTVSKEDDGLPVTCIVDHPAVKDFRARKYLEVQCKYCSFSFHILELHWFKVNTFSFTLTFHGIYHMLEI